MGSAMSYETLAGTTPVRRHDISRKVTFEQYLQHISGTHGANCLRALPDALLNPRFILLQHLSIAFHAIAQLPAEAPYYLPHLTHLDCSHNLLTSLPVNFGHFLHIKILLLPYNSLSSLPDSVAEMQQLERVDLSHNQFVDFPAVLTSLDSLQQINVSFNMLSLLPTDLAKNKRLCTIICHMNRCKSPPQEVCDKGTAAILSYFALVANPDQAGAAEGAPASSTTVAAAATPTTAFKRVPCVEAPSLLTRLRPSRTSPTLNEKQKTPLRIPKDATSLSESELIDRIAGLVYGAALGDAVGLATEFMLREECQFHYGVGGERLSYSSIVQDRHRCKWQRGDWTDDTDQMTLILSSLLHWGGVIDEVDFAKRLVAWCEQGFPELGDTIGLGVGATIGKISMKPEFLTQPHDTAQKMWQGTDNAANGAIMRTSILGVPHFHDLDTVTDNTLRICKTTHYDPRCQASCVAVCCAIALLLQGKHDVTDPSQVELLLSEAAQRGRDLLSSEKHLTDYDHYTSVRDVASVMCAKAGQIGYTLKPMGASWAAMRMSGDFESVITALVMEGGDADSNATVAGAVLGARLGYSQLPVDWLHGLLSKNVQWLDAKINALLDLMALN